MSTLLPLYSKVIAPPFLSRGLCSNPLVVERVQIENDLALVAQESKANNVARQQRDDQRRAVMHEWPISLTDDRFKEWRHMQSPKRQPRRWQEMLRLIHSSVEPGTPGASTGATKDASNSVLRGCKQSKLLGDPQERT